MIWVSCLHYFISYNSDKIEPVTKNLLGNTRILLLCARNCQCQMWRNKLSSTWIFPNTGNIMKSCFLHKKSFYPHPYLIPRVPPSKGWRNERKGCRLWTFIWLWWQDWRSHKIETLNERAFVLPIELEKTHSPTNALKGNQKSYTSL